MGERGEPRTFPTSDGWIAELVGGAVCLDFTNTVPTFLAPAAAFVDHLPDYASLLAWTAQAELLDEATLARLRRAATRHPGEAVRVLARARELRAAIFAAFDASARGQRIEAATLATLSRFGAQAAAHRSLVARGDAIELVYVHDDDALDTMLWPIAGSAVELLASPRRARVRVCEAASEERCTWLFVDESKNHSRRWCSMRDCGNRNKVRRHHDRQRRAAPRTRG